MGIFIGGVFFVAFFLTGIGVALGGSGAEAHHAGLFIIFTCIAALGAFVGFNADNGRISVFSAIGNVVALFFALGALYQLIAWAAS